MWTIYGLSEILILSIIWTVSNGETQIAVSEGGNTCVLNETDVYCWGEGTNGILGTGDTSHLYEPPATAIDLGSAFAVEQLECGGYHCCGVSSNKTLKCWGHNGYGRLGQGDTNNRGDEPGEMGHNLSVIDLGSDFEVDHVSCGGRHTCALSTNYEIKCFGLNDYGQLGYGNTDNIGDGEAEMGDGLSVVNLGTAFVPIRVDSGGRHSCALSQKSTIKCWGMNHVGQLGQGDTNDRGDNSDEMGDNLTPIHLGTGFIVSKIRCGAWQVCALSTDHDMKCWGQNNVYGRLGLGDTNNRGDNNGEMGDDLPVVDLGKEFVIEHIGGGSDHTLALSKNGSMKAWGRNDRGQLGYGDVNLRGDQEYEMGDYLDFVDLGTGFTVTSISSSSDTQHSCALLENGSAFLGLKCWGLNDHGELGLGDTDNRGEEANEMGDDLAFVSFVFGSLPTQFPTTEPTVLPTIPTFDPTNEPTISPTVYPTTYPTTYPTLEPTTKCETYLNCTECTNLNTGHIPQCLWHFVDEHCYYLKELDSAEIYENENVFSDHSDCVPTTNPTVYPSNNPTADPTTDSTANPTNNPSIEPNDDPTTAPTQSHSFCTFIQLDFINFDGFSADELETDKMLQISTSNASKMAIARSAMIRDSSMKMDSFSISHYSVTEEVATVDGTIQRTMSIEQQLCAVTLVDLESLELIIELDNDVIATTFASYLDSDSSEPFDVSISIPSQFGAFTLCTYILQIRRCILCALSDSTVDPKTISWNFQLILVVVILMILLCITIIIIWKMRKNHSNLPREPSLEMPLIPKLQKEESFESRHGVIGCIAIGKYDGSEYSDLPVNRDVENLRKFSKFMGYDFIERPNKLYWTEEEINSFLINDIGNNLFRQNGKPKYDLIMICISGHGLRDRVVTSDCQSMDRTDIHRVISMKYPKIRDVPRIFVFDACAGWRQCIPKGPEVHHVVAASSEDASDEVEISVIGKNTTDEEDTKEAEAWTSTTKNPDYKMVVINSANIGFQAHMRSDEVGSLLLYLFTKKLRRNIENHEQKGLAEIMDEIQKELHDGNKQQIECIFNNGTRNLVLDLKRKRFKCVT